MLLHKLKKIELSSNSNLVEPRTKQSIEPDVVIEINDCILIVEAELSAEFEASQLIEQFMTSQKLYRQEKKKIYHLLLNKTLCRPGSLNNIIKELCGRFKRLNIEAPNPDILLSHLLWFNWQSIIEVFQKCLKIQLSELESRIIMDTIKTVLEAANGILLPVTPPTDKLEKFGHSKSDIILVHEFLQKIFTFDSHSLASMQHNRDRIIAFVQYLEKVVHKF